jgi:hypothetical protein
VGRETQGFAALSPAQRQLAASLGSLTNWSRKTSAEARRNGTQAARDARRARFEAEADPTGELPPDELAAAVQRLQRAHMRRMALASAASRRRAA